MDIFEDLAATGVSHEARVNDWLKVRAAKNGECSTKILLECMLILFSS